MYQIALIFIGGGLGSLVRFSVSKYFPSQAYFNLPIATFLSNFVASLILGLFIGMELNGKMPINYRYFIAVGFCGGFSTFSTFSADTLQLMQTNRIPEAFLNVFINMVLCILATFVGIYFTK
jgi:CrcB protein